jgi:hypothetical protein
MIKRLKHRRSHGTLVANPRRKKRNGARRHKRRSLRSMFANPRKHKRKKVRNGGKLSSFLKKHKVRRRATRRNGMDIGGVDLVSVGIGSVAAIALGAVGQGIFNKYLAQSVSSEPLAKAAPSLIVAGAAFAAHKYMKNPKVKNIAKVTLVLSIFKAIDDSLGDKLRDTVKNALPGATGGYMAGGYIPALKGYNTSGAYVDAATGGAYTHVTHGILPGAGLYGL